MHHQLRRSVGLDTFKFIMGWLQNNERSPSTLCFSCRQYGGMQQEHLFKVLVVGDLGVGKTSIIKRYVHQIFSQHYRATIGVDFALKVLQWDNDTVIRLQLWDIAGQERYGNMTRVYYREAVGALVVFDVTRASTFEAVLKWKDDLDSKVAQNEALELGILCPFLNILSKLKLIPIQSPINIIETLNGKSPALV
ncbi:hypothetical protein GOODEAATRI_015319 [Goodea atripinnis]|uniref:Ras-related protein Rab n=1 Tax=Goodea atripinnis TaxID=208336 RepID=A0ABV0NKS6_9TELE